MYFRYQYSRLGGAARIVLGLLVFSFLGAGRVFAIVPAPFPLCSGDIDSTGFHTQLNAGYSFMQTSMADIGYVDFGLKAVFADNRAGRPSLHMALYGAKFDGDGTDEDGIFKRYDIEGDLIGVSLTPSIIISDQYIRMKPVFFIGVHAQVQTGKYEHSQFDDATNLNSDDWTRPVYNPYVGGYLPIDQDIVASGFHTGVQLAMQYDSFSLNPFLMVHYSHENVDWNDPYGVQIDYTANYIMNSVGIDLRMVRPEISVTFMAQFARDDDGDDAAAYTFLTGISF